MENAMLIRWTPAAGKGSNEPTRAYAPLHVVLGEAVDVAAFFESHYEVVVDESGAITRPGLELAVSGGQFRPELGAELLELQEAAAAAQTKYALLVPTTKSPMDRAKYVLGELVAGLDFLFDDNVEDIDDQRLENLAETHDGAASQDAVAAALNDYAGFAEMHIERLNALGAFETGLIAEGSALASSLRQHSAQKVAGTADSSQRDALKLRNQLVAMLCERMQIVRSAARYIFRHQPEIARRVASDYMRQKTARYRRRQAAQSADAPANLPN